MTKYHVIGSSMEYMFSLDCEADSHGEALSMFATAFEKEGNLSPSVLDLDKSYEGEVPRHIEGMRQNWVNGRQWESGGYHYG